MPQGLQSMENCDFKNYGSNELCILFIASSCRKFAFFPDSVMSRVSKLLANKAVCNLECITSC